MSHRWFFLLALVSGIAFGSTENVRLSFEQHALDLQQQPVSPHLKIEVTGEGLAQGTLQGPNGESHRIYLKVFLQQELNEIEKLISEANKAETETRTPICLAIPSKKFVYTASNGEILLYGAALPCGGDTRNLSAASQQLIRILDGLNLLFQEELESN